VVQGATKASAACSKTFSKMILPVSAVLTWTEFRFLQ